MPAAVWVILLLVLPMVILEIMYRRSVKRMNEAMDELVADLKFKSRLLGLQDTDPAWHAMRCVICGGFHPEDDDECPTIEA